MLDLFSGIGGFSLGLERAGMETVAFCEIEEYPRKVLAKHWPNVPIYNDVRELTGERLKRDGITNIDVLCGGWPCQPFSHAGKKAGERDPRYLWPEVVRLLREVAPRWFIGENVDGFIGLSLANTLFNLEVEGYISESFVIPACAAGLNQRRDRVWIIAYRESIHDISYMERDASISKFRGITRDQGVFPPSWPADKHSMAGESHGIPYWMDRVRGLGGAVVPQIPEIIGRAIMAIENV